MSKRLFSFQQALSQVNQKRRHFFYTVGWDGIALLLNLFLLSLNLRQHFRYRESPERYQPVRAEAIHLLTEKEVVEIHGTPKTSVPPTEKITSSSEGNSLQDAKKKALPSFTANKASEPISNNTHHHAAVTPGTVLSSVKIPVLPLPDTAKSEVIDAPDSQCSVFGPLTFNRLQQLQKMWKHEGHDSALSSVTSQPLHHYSVIFPALLSAAANNKRAALEKAGFKHHELWTEGKSHSVIVIGSFEVAAAANNLLQRLHQKGFREAYLMVRTSPTVYWLQRSEDIKHWLDQSTISRAEGVHWKAVPCSSAPALMPSSSR